MAGSSKVQAGSAFPHCLLCVNGVGGPNDDAAIATHPHGGPEWGRSGGDLAEATQLRLWFQGRMLVLSGSGWALFWAGGPGLGNVPSGAPSLLAPGLGEATREWLVRRVALTKGTRVPPTSPGFASSTRVLRDKEAHVADP